MDKTTPFDARTVLDAVACGVTVQDGAGAILFTNSAARRIPGLGIGESPDLMKSERTWLLQREDGWVVMPQHPTFAHDLLQPIKYLRPAIDIPYCHHEKWDGTGYPQGLRRTQIPLSARIFAVVDVWDALSSGRPYRSGRPETQVREHKSCRLS